MALQAFGGNRVAEIIKKSKIKTQAPKLKIKGGLIRMLEEVNKIAHQKLGRFENEYKCLYTKEEVHSYLFDNIDKDTHIALDTETGPRDVINGRSDDGLDYYKGHVVGICLTAPRKDSVYIPVNHLDPATGERLLKQLTEDEIRDIFIELLNRRPDIKFDYHNSEFDIRMLIHTFDLPIDFIDTFGWDTLLVSHCIDENTSHKLKELHYQYYPEQYQGRDVHYEIVEFSDLFSGVPFAFVNPETAKLYAAGDTFKTDQVKQKQVEYLMQPGNELFSEEIRNVELGCVPPTIRMEERGMKVNIELLDKADAEYTELIDKYETACYAELEKFSKEIANYRFKHRTQKKQSLSDPIKLNSPSQINTLMFDVLGVKLDKDSTKKQTKQESMESDDSTDKKALLAIIRKYPIYKPFIKNLLKYRNVYKMKSTYIDAIREKLGPDGKIHCTFKPNGTVTGRYSSKSPNLQNIPKDPTVFRNLFIPDIGFAFGGGDYSKQEVFLTVEECYDPALIQVFKDGKDIYSVLASTIYNVPYRECLEFETNEDGSWKLNENGERISYHDGKMRRGTGKTGWLGLTYGLGPAGLMAKANEDMQKEIDEKVEKGEEFDPEEYKFITLEEATHILNQIKKGFPVAFEWIEKTHKFVHENGYVENMYGRRRHLPNILLPKYSVRLIRNKNTDQIVIPSCLEEDPLDFETNFEDKKYTLEDVPKEVYASTLNEMNKTKSAWKAKQLKEYLRTEEKLDVMENGQLIAQAERQAVNSKIQGDAGVLIKSVIINIDKDPELKKYGCGLVNTIHDEIIAEIDANHVSECMNALNRVMVGTAEQVVKSVKVKSDLTATKCWYGEFIGEEISWTKE